MAPRWSTWLCWARGLLLPGVCLAVFFVPVGMANAAPVCGASACVEISATEPVIVIDLGTGAGVGFDVTVSDTTPLPLPVDFALSEGLNVVLASVIVGRIGELPVTTSPGGSASSFRTASNPVSTPSVSR